MSNQQEMPKWMKVIRNAAVLGAITMISNLVSAGGFSWSAVWAGFLAGLLVAFIEIQHAYKIIPTSSVDKKGSATFFFSS